MSSKYFRKIMSREVKNNQCIPNIKQNSYGSQKISQEGSIKQRYYQENSKTADPKQMKQVKKIQEKISQKVVRKTILQAQKLNKCLKSYICLYKS